MSGMLGLLGMLGMLGTLGMLLMLGMLGFRVQGSGFTVQGLGIRAWDFRWVVEATDEILIGRIGPCL